MENLHEENELIGLIKADDGLSETKVYCCMYGANVYFYSIVFSDHSNKYYETKPHLLCEKVAHVHIYIRGSGRLFYVGRSIHFYISLQDHSASEGEFIRCNPDEKHVCRAHTRNDYGLICSDQVMWAPGGLKRTHAAFKPPMETRDIWAFCQLVCNVKVTFHWYMLRHLHTQNIASLQMCVW